MLRSSSTRVAIPDPFCRIPTLVATTNATKPGRGRDEETFAVAPRGANIHDFVPLALRHAPDLRHESRARGEVACDRERLVLRRDLNEVEAAELLLRLHERPVGDDPVADELAAVLERLAGNERAAFAEPTRELHVLRDDPPPLVARQRRLALRVAPQQDQIAHRSSFVA